VSSNQLSVSIPGLSPFTQYNCTVQAETLASGPAGVATTVVTPQDGQYNIQVEFMGIIGRRYFTITAKRQRESQMSHA